MKFRLTLTVLKDGNEIEAPDEEPDGVYECPDIFELMRRLPTIIPFEAQWRERGMELLDVRIETVK